MSQYGDVYDHFLGFAHVSGRSGLGGGLAVIAIPYWFIVLLTAIAPVTLWRQRRQSAQGAVSIGCKLNLSRVSV